jgi:hypothetical protein
MSTSIHNAYRLRPGVDAFALRREALATLAPVLLREHAQELLNRAVEHYNGQWVLDKERKSFEQVLRQELAAELKESEEPLTSATIMVFENSELGEYYIKVYGALTRHHEAILALDAVAEDFYYSNAVSAPEGFTRAQWQRRGDAWDTALDGGNGPLITCGVEIHLFSGFSARLDFQRLRDLGAEMPDREWQAHHLGLSLAMQETIDQVAQAERAQAGWRRYLDWTNGHLDKTPYMAEAHVLLNVRPEPVLP